MSQLLFLTPRSNLVALVAYPRLAGETFVNVNEKINDLIASRDRNRFPCQFSSYPRSALSVSDNKMYIVIRMFVREEPLFNIRNL